MIVDLNVENLLNGPFDILDPGVAEFDYFTCVGQDHVIVLLVEEGLLVMGLILTELMPSNQSTIEQELYGVVKGGSADPVILVLHLDVQGLDVKMIIVFIDLLQNCKSFRSFPVLIVF